MNPDHPFIGKEVMIWWNNFNFAPGQGTLLGVNGDWAIFNGWRDASQQASKKPIVFTVRLANIYILDFVA